MQHHLPAPGPTLRTARLTLRRLEASDAAAMVAYASSRGFFDFITDVPERLRTRYGLADALDHVRELHALEREGLPHWGIVADGVGFPVGAIRFNRGAGQGVPDLGYALGSPWWGRGYAKEAAAAVLRWADGHVPEVGAVCDRGNLASERVLLAVGFQPLGPDAAGRLVFQRTSPGHLAGATKP